MAGLDTSPLRNMVIAYMNKDPMELNQYENEMLNELVTMMVDFDARFVQYPLICAKVLADCIEAHSVDLTALKACVDLLASVDQQLRRYKC